MGLKRLRTSPLPGIFEDPDRENVLNSIGSTRPILPSFNTAEKLSRAYFNNIHPQYPILHRPTFRQWEQQCLEANCGSHVSGASDVPMFFVSIVYAIGSLALERSNFEAAEHYYSMALNHIGPVLDMDSLESIQAILSIAIYSVRSPSGPSVWKISGMAMRHCIELGYHRNAGRFRKTGEVLRIEMSKRCFWVAYDFDRYVSSILGLPNAIPDDSIDTEVCIVCIRNERIAEAHYSSNSSSRWTSATIILPQRGSYILLVPPQQIHQPISPGQSM